MTDAVPAEYRAFAHRLADAAGAAIRPCFRIPLDVEEKDDASPVTLADREAERVMRDLVAAEFPRHGIIGEEYGATNADAEWVWVFDPIDGTRAFIAGMPTFGTLIALLHGEKPVLGILDQPIRNERWTGVSGQNATLNGRPIKTRRCPSLDRAVLFTTDPDIFQGQDRQTYKRLANQVKLKRYSADCYAYGVLALGFADIVCESELKLYDFAALIPLIEQAGGIVSDWKGAPLDKRSDGKVLACGDRTLHRQALEALGSSTQT